MMSRPYPGRRRRRPRRRLRYLGGGFPPRSDSYQDFGLRPLYDLILPRGRERRLFFNDVSGGMAIWFGVLGGLLGWGMLGPLGVILGFGGGIAFGASFLTRHRYYRR
jgi:hypothetical protein